MEADMENRLGQLIILLDNFIKGNYYYDGSNVDEMSKVYDTACSLEKVCERLVERNLWPFFIMTCLESLSVNGNNNLKRDLLLVRRACDLVITRTLTNSRICNNEMRTSMEQYLNRCDADRLKSVTIKITQTRKAYLELSDISNNINHSDSVELEARFIFAAWIKQGRSVGHETTDLYNGSIERLILEKGGALILFYMLTFHEESDEGETLKRSVVSFWSRSTSSAVVEIWKNLLKLSGSLVKNILFTYPEILVVILDSILPVDLNGDKNNHLSSDSIALFKMLYSVGGPVWQYVKCKCISRHCNLMDATELMELIKYPG